jgi:hypothetical protein
MMAAERGAPTASTGAAAAASPSIRLKTSLLVPHLHEERYALLPGATTVAGVLNAIGGSAGVRLIGGDGELDRHFDVRLNGKRIDFHPARLATPLVHDDLLVVQLIPIGGG